MLYFSAEAQSFILFYGRLFPILLLLVSCFVVNLSGVYHQHNKPIFTEKMFVIPDLKT